tara:strand:- start:137711 stop:138829 length:1119 start_codon:yes stop_codon:yes gene_type:complete
VLKITKSYTKSKNKQGMTKIHSYLAIFGIMVGIIALIVVSSAMSGFSKDLYNKLKIDSDAEIYLLENSDLKEKIERKENIKEIKESFYLPDYVVTVGDKNIVNLFVKENKKYSDLDVIYLSSTLKNKIKNKFITLELKQGTLVEDQLILKVKYIDEIKDFRRVYISKETLLTQSFIDLHSSLKKVYDVYFEDFMNSQDLIKEFKTEKNVYMVYSWTEKKADFFSALQIEQTVIKIVLFFIILVSCVNIISTLTLIITEKKQDIYVLKTIGYSNKEILSIFLLVGCWLGFLGLILGTILGITITLNLTEILYVLENILGITFIPKAITKFPYVLDIKEIISINIFTSLIILISSILPALKTLKMTPAEGLKDE